MLIAEADVNLGPHIPKTPVWVIFDPQHNTCIYSLYSAGLQVDLHTKSKCLAMQSILLLIHYEYLLTDDVIMTKCK